MRLLDVLRQGRLRQEAHGALVAEEGVVPFWDGRGQLARVLVDAHLVLRRSGTYLTWWTLPRSPPAGSGTPGCAPAAS